MPDLTPDLDTVLPLLDGHDRLILSATSAACLLAAVLALGVRPRAHSRRAPRAGLPTPWRAIGVVCAAGLAGIGLIGAATSYVILRDAAAQHVAAVLAPGFPLLIDAMILFGSGRYVYLVKTGVIMPIYRRMAWGGIAVTIFFNVLASPSWDDVFWHVVAPACWGLVTEAFAKEALGASGRSLEAEIERRRLRPWLAWLAAPRGMFHLRRHELLTRVVDERIRQDAAIVSAARMALTDAVPGWRRTPRRTRRTLISWVRDRSIRPEALLAAIQEAQARAQDDPTRTPTVLLAIATERVLEGRTPHPRKRTPEGRVRPAGKPRPPAPVDRATQITPEMEDAAYAAYAVLRREREAAGADERIADGALGALFDPPQDRFVGRRRRQEWETRYAAEERPLSAVH